MHTYVPTVHIIKEFLETEKLARATAFNIRAKQKNYENRRRETLRRLLPSDQVSADIARVFEGLAAAWLEAALCCREAKALKQIHSLLKQVCAV